MKNAVGREIPASLAGYKEIVPYAGAFATRPPAGQRHWGRMAKAVYPRDGNKVLRSIEDAVDASGLRDGMTVSFHHGLRNGDYVMNMVMKAIQKKGIKGLTLVPSSFQNANDELIPLLEDGTVIAAQTSWLRSRLGHFLTMNRLSRPTIVRPHGGRVRAIESGEVKIDVAFLAAPTADAYGNVTGVLGPAACGSLGYAMVDAQYADTVVAVTDNLVDHLLCPVSIPQHLVDFVVTVDAVGDPGALPRVRCAAPGTRAT